MAGREELGVELSEEGQRRFEAMSEQPSIPGASKKRIAGQEAELAKTHGQRRTVAKKAKGESTPRTAKP